MADFLHMQTVRGEQLAVAVGDAAGQGGGVKTELGGFFQAGSGLRHRPDRAETGQ